MKYFSTLFILCLPLVFQAQEAPKIEPHVIASSGDQLTSAELKLDFTLGEFMIQSLVGEVQLTQGFHQGRLKMTTAATSPEYSGEIIAFPNPTAAQIQVHIDPPIAGVLLVHDARGAIVHRSEIQTETTIDMQSLPPAMYLLQVQTQGKRIYTAKIQKF